MAESGVALLEDQEEVTMEDGVCIAHQYGHVLAETAALPEARVGRKQFSLGEVKAALRQDPVIFAHLIDGTSPFGAHVSVAGTWKQDGDTIVRQLMHHINMLKDDQNGVTLVIACDGAYQKGGMGHLMIWNVAVEGTRLKLQTGNQESIGGKHFPTEKINTVELWQRHNPSGSKNSNHPGQPVDEFAKTAVGISVAQYGLYINFFPCTASENFEAAIATLSAMEAGQDFGFFDGQKSCFTTARDLLGAIKTRGPLGEDVDWSAGKPQPVVPDILNKLSLLTNNERQIGVETARGRLYDLTDKLTRREVAQDRAVFAELAAGMGGWINKKPGAYTVRIRPAL